MSRGSSSKSGRRFQREALAVGRAMGGVKLVIVVLESVGVSKETGRNDFLAEGSAGVSASCSENVAGLAMPNSALETAVPASILRVEREGVATMV